MASVGNNKSPNLSEKGQPGIASISKFIDDLRRSELKMPQRLCTFDQMCEDASGKLFRYSSVPVCYGVI